VLWRAPSNDAPEFVRLFDLDMRNFIVPVPARA
jgi:hypothetical protein